MFDTFYALLPIPLGVFCIIYGFLSGADKGRQETGTLPISIHNDEKSLNEDQFSLPQDPQFRDPDINKLEDQDILYYQILMIGLGFGAITLGLDTYFPGLASLSKIILITTLALALMIRFLTNKEEERPALESAHGLQAHKQKQAAKHKETAEKNSAADDTHTP